MPAKLSGFFMNKRIFFDKLHDKLSQEFSRYFLTASDIKYIRSNVLGPANRSPEELVVMLQKKITRVSDKDTRESSLRILAFLAKSNPEEFLVICQKTKFDR